MSATSDNGSLPSLEEDGILSVSDELLMEVLQLSNFDTGGDHYAPKSSRELAPPRLETAREREQATAIGKAIAANNGAHLVRLLKDFYEGPPLALARVLESINDMMQDGGMDCKESIMRRDALFVSGLADAVASTIATFPDNADVAAFGALAVGCIAYAPPPVPISERKGPRPTSYTERKVAKAAGIDLTERTESSTQEERRERLILVGAVDTIFRLLQQHPDDEEVQENVLWAIGNIAKHLEEQPKSSASASRRYSRADSEVPSSSRGEEQENGAARLIKLGIAPVLLRSIDQHRNHRGVQTAGFRAAAFLVDPLVPGFERRAEVLIACGMSEALVVALDAQTTDPTRGNKEASDPEVVRWCLFVASNLAKDSHTRCEVLMELGIGPLLVAAIHNNEHNPLIQEVGLTTLANLCANSESRKAALAEYGCCEPITYAMENHSQNALIQERGLAAAGNLILGGRMRCRFLVFNGLVDLTIAAMQRPTNYSNRGVQYRGCLCFYLIAAYGGPYGAPRLLANSEVEKSLRTAMKNFARDRYGVVKWAVAALKELGLPRGDG